MTPVFVASAVLLLTPGQLIQPPARWAYAELTYRDVPTRPGGTGPKGEEMLPVPRSSAIRWATAEEELEMKSWAELTKRLKGPEIKDGQSLLFQRVQVLNHLGSLGWELVALHETPSTLRAVEPSRSWTFKRRQP